MATTEPAPNKTKLRILFIGSFGSGKTTMVHSFLSGKPLVIQEGKIESVPPAPEVAGEVTAPTYVKEMKLDGREIKLYLVDTAGEESFSTVSCSFYKVRLKGEESTSKIIIIIIIIIIINFFQKRERMPSLLCMIAQMNVRSKLHRIGLERLQLLHQIKVNLFSLFSHPRWTTLPRA